MASGELHFGASISYDELPALNPRLVYCSISGFGEQGPYRDWPGQDLQAQAMGGLVALTGFRGDPQGSVPAGAAVADAVTGIVATLGIVSALYARHRTGRGQRVETSLLAAALAMHPDFVAIALGAGSEIPKAGPGASLLPPPFGVYTAKDGKELAISGVTRWPEFCHCLGVPELADDPRFNEPEARRDNWDELRKVLVKAVLKRTRDELVEALQKDGHMV